MFLRLHLEAATPNAGELGSWEELGVRGAYGWKPKLYMLVIFLSSRQGFGHVEVCAAPYALWQLQKYICIYQARATEIALDFQINWDVCRRVCYKYFIAYFGTDFQNHSNFCGTPVLCI